MHHLDHFIHQKNSEGVANFKNMLDVEEEKAAAQKWYLTELQMREDDLKLYDECLSLYSNYTNELEGYTFKPSALKSNKELAFIPTNLHYQEMKITNKKQPSHSTPLSIYDHVTVGAPAAHVFKFHSGGLFALESQYYKLEKKLKKEKKSIQKARYERKLESLSYQISRRRDMTTCQATGALCTCFVKRIQTELAFFPSRLEQFVHCGFLIHFEGLLSTYGSEIGMLSDFTKAIESLELFQLQIVLGTEKDVDCSGLPSKVILDASSHGHPVFKVYLPPSLWNLCPASVRNQRMDVFPILFTQGINEFQSIANKIGETSLQDQINQVSLFLFWPLLKGKMKLAPLYFHEFGLNFLLFV